MRRMVLLLLVIIIPFCHASELNLVYDANGNLISGDGYFREYNGFNQLSKVYLGDNDSVLLQEYVFHPVEERVWIKKTYNSTGNITEKVIYWNKNFVTVVNDSGMYNYTYVYFNGQLVAQELDGVKTFIHSDHIGSATVVTNEAGEIIENTTYAPYGSIIEGGSETRFNYEGKEYDSVVGDTDFNFRKYDQDLGIFTQPDSLIQNVFDPQSLNRYMFERGNPYKYVDQDGHIISEIIHAIRLVRNPSIRNFVSLGNSLLTDNLLTVLGGGIGWEIASDAYTILSGSTMTLDEFTANREDNGIYDDPLTIAILRIFYEGISFHFQSLNINNANVINQANQVINIPNTDVETNYESMSLKSITSKLLKGESKSYQKKYNQAMKSRYDLEKIANDNQDKTAGEIIKKWRAKV